MTAEQDRGGSNLVEALSKKKAHVYAVLDFLTSPDGHVLGASESSPGHDGFVEFGRPVINRNGEEVLERIRIYKGDLVFLEPYLSVVNKAISLSPIDIAQLNYDDVRTAFC